MSKSSGGGGDLGCLWWFLGIVLLFSFVGVAYYDMSFDEAVRWAFPLVAEGTGWLCVVLPAIVFALVMVGLGIAYVDDWSNKRGWKKYADLDD